jgi:hypothetical protein
VLDVSTEKLLRSIFQTLAYADVFEYPLTAYEVYRYLGFADTTLEEVTGVLRESTLFSKVEEYHTLRGREEIVGTRKRRAEVARRLWPKASRYGRIIAALPFVQMVAVTGSLAVNNAEAGGDIDFMIVTAPNRLWSCRALSLLVARFAKREGIQLCPNYLVTTNALVLEERSLYVAHEVAQMIPLSGLDVYHELRRLNDWTDDFLPNTSSTPDLPQDVKGLQGRSLIKSFLEFLLALPPGNWFEGWEMNRKIGRLRREQSSSQESYFSPDVCKGHIDRHGESIETAFAVRLQKIS